MKMRMQKKKQKMDVKNKDLCFLVEVVEKEQKEEKKQRKNKILQFNLCIL